MSWSSLFRRSSTPRTSQAPRRASRVRPILEELEGRLAPAIFNVNTTADTQAVNLTTGQDASGNVSLRSALEAANATPGGNTIRLTVAGTYALNAPTIANEADNLAGELVILPTGGDLTIINTNGDPVAVNAQNNSRVFDVNPFAAATPFTVTLQGFTVENGHAADATGQDPGGVVASGGGLRDQGGAALILDGMVFSNNSATGAGGGLWSDGTSTTVTQSTFQNNSAGGKGGGVFVGGGTFLLRNSTVTGNTSSAGAGAPDVFGQVSDLATSTGNTLGVTDAANTNLSNGLRAANLQFNTPLGTAGVFVDPTGNVFELASALGGSVNLTQALNLGPSLYASVAFSSTGQVLVLTQQDGRVLQLTVSNGQGSISDITATFGEGTSRAVSVALVNGVEFLVATDTAGNVNLAVPGSTSSPVNLTSLFNLTPAQTATLNFNSLNGQLALVVTDVNGGVSELSLAGVVNLTPFLGATAGKTASLAFPGSPNAGTAAVLDSNEAGDVLVTFLVNGAATGPVNLGTTPFPTTTGGTTTGTGQVTLTPAVEEGPFFQDFSDSTLNRSDVTEGQQGVPLTLTFHVYQVSGTTVTPLSGVRVDIWNANAFGVYSDEASQGTTGQTFLRGYQFTDATGTVTFQTIIPGWYSGRTPHVHFMIRSASSSGALTDLLTSQVFFDQSFINSLDTTTAPYNTRGLPDTTNATDRVYNTLTSTGTAAGPLLTLSLTQTASGYAATYNVYVAG